MTAYDKEIVEKRLFQLEETLDELFIQQIKKFLLPKKSPKKSQR